jgi:hypothetical protein
MSDECKPCKPCRKDISSDEYLLVKASSSTASSTEPQQQGSEAACRKQEEMYDEILSGFILPLSTSNTNINVCNSSIYSIGQWIQFLNPSVTMQIVGINGNVLTVVNRCENGQDIEANPISGTVIAERTRFSIVGRPRCSALSERAEELQFALSDLEEICTPSMVESNPDSDIHPVGRVETNPNDVNFGRCLRKIYGFFFKKGTPVFPHIKKSLIASNNSFNKLGISKISKEVWELPNYSEDPKVVSGKNYVIVNDSIGEKIIGPARIYVPFDSLVHSIGDLTPYSGVAASGSPLQVAGTFNLSAGGLDSAFNEIININIADFYAEFQIIYFWGTQTDINHFTSFEFNGEQLVRDRSWFNISSRIINIRVPLASRATAIPYLFSTRNASNVQQSTAFNVAMKIKLTGLYV